jgi:alkylhydroperoxidase family enzyme
VSDETWTRVREHYDDDQIAALVSLIALINATTGST